MNHTLKRNVLSLNAALLCIAIPASALAESTEVDSGQASSAKSEERSMPRIAATIQPLALISRSVLVDAGVELGSNFSLMLDAHTIQVKNDDARGDVDGFGVGVQYALFGAMEGPYLYPRMGLDTASLVVDGEKIDTSIMSVGGTAGYQWWWSPVTLRVGGGASYAWVDDVVRNDQRKATGAGFVPRVDVNIGVAF
jgi:hypothetical protein